MSYPFPTDRRSVIRYVRAFANLVAERLSEGRDIPLPNGLTMDHVLSGLAAYEAGWDATARDFQLVDDEGEPELLVEIVETLREVFDDLAGPDTSNHSVN